MSTMLNDLNHVGVVESERPVKAQLNLAEKCEQMLEDACKNARPAGDKVVYEHQSLQEGHPQGDVAVQYLGEVLPAGIDLVQVSGLKLDTRLSLDNEDGVGDHESHKLVILEGMKVYRLQTPHPLAGYYIHLEPNAKLLVEHDEHAAVEMLEPGWYVTRFQRIAVNQQVRAEMTVVRNVD